MDLDLLDLDIEGPSNVPVKQFTRFKPKLKQEVQSHPQKPESSSLLQPKPAMDLDLLDLDIEGPSNVPVKQSTRFKPKLKQEVQSQLQKTEPSSLLQPKPESVTDAFVFQMKEDTFFLPSSSHDILKREEHHELEGEAEPMDVGIREEEDYVVREIDVSFAPSLGDDGAQLYVMQYPLRPSWRPYEGFQEVRVKPKQSKIELDVEVNVSGDNYDADVPDRLKLEKQILSSKQAPVTGYAIGILKGNKLHMNPVHSVVQLRPSMAYLKGGGVEKKFAGNQNVEAASKLDERRAVRDASHKEVTEPWTSLEYHGVESSISSKYREKLMSEESTHIQFNMSPCDYISSVYPVTSNNKKHKGPSRRDLLSRPLEERFKRWFSEGPEVNRFQTLMHLAPTNSEEEVFKVLKQQAHLVQGLWVAKTELRRDGGGQALSGAKAFARDFVLLLFNKNEIVHNDQLKSVKTRYDDLKDAMMLFAIKRSAVDEWKFREPADELFKKNYPNIVKEQERAWVNLEKHLMDFAHKRAKSGLTMNTSKPVKSAVSITHNRNGKGYLEGNLSSEVSRTMSKETCEALPKALERIFNDYKVCSLEQIRRTLQDMAVLEAKLPKPHAKFALPASHAPLSEIQAVIKQFAIEIHGVYLLKPQGSTDLDNLRRAIINLFSVKEPNAKLKKADILEAAKIILKRETTNQEYNKVMNEYCVSDRGGWMLKSGDGLK